MNRLPVSILYSHDPVWQHGIRGHLEGLSEVVPVTDGTALELLLQQHGHIVLFLDLCGTDALTMLPEWVAQFPDAVMIALGDARSDPGILALRLGVQDILAVGADRLRVQALFRQVQTQVRLRKELRMLREERRTPDALVPAVAARDKLSPFLLHLSGALRRFDNLELMLENIAEGVVQGARVSRVGIVTIMADGAYRFRSGINCLERNREIAFAPGDPLVIWLQVHAHCITRSMLRHVEPLSDRVMLEESLDANSAELILPLFGRNRLIGWLCLGRPRSGAPFEDQDVEDLSRLADQVSVVIENAMLHDSIAVQKALAENLLQTVPFGIIAVAPGGQIRWFNSGAGHLLHTTPGEKGDWTLNRLPAFLTDMLLRCVGGEGGIGPVEWVEPIAQRAVSLQARRLEQDGVCMGAMLLLKDLTEERLFREKQSNLERAVFWNELTSALSHEVRNPLVAISTFAQLLPERYQDEEFRTHFRELTTQEVERLNSIVDQLDQFANPPDLCFAPIDVAELLQEVLFKDRSAGHREPEVKVHVAGDVPCIRGDREILAQALGHLLENAHAAVAGRMDSRISVHVQGGEIGDGRAAVVLEVRDNGEGIPEEMQSKVFSPFCTSKTRGVGLGLAIVRRTMIDHEGLVEIDSGPGGTTVRLTLPAVWQEAQEKRG